MDPPPAENIEKSMFLLWSLKALDNTGAFMPIIYSHRNFLYSTWDAELQTRLAWAFLLLSTPCGLSANRVFGLLLFHTNNSNFTALPLGAITPLGRKMVEFPLDPPLAKMLLFAEELVGGASQGSS